MTDRLFHVFVEHPRSSATGAVAELARAMAAHYGLGATELEARIAAGRFRVKSNVDRATADSFAADLERLGATCSVVSVSEPAPPQVAAPAVTLQQGRVAAPPRPGAAAPRSPAPAPAAKPPAGAMPAIPPPKASLAAPPRFNARAGTEVEVDVQPEEDDGGLGALSSLSLAMLDGSDDPSGDRSADRALSSSSFGPPSESPLPASFGPAPESSREVPVARSARDSKPPVVASRGSVRDLAAGAGADLFAPPEEAGATELALDIDMPAKRPSGAMAAAPATATAPASGRGAKHETGAPSSRGAGAAKAEALVAIATPAEPQASAEPGWRRLARDQRARFVAGAVLSAVVGFVPATLIASVRERSAYAELDTELARRHAQITNRADWEALDGVRASFVERKRAERQSIAFMTLVMWAALSGGFAWVWFRKIDWDHVLGPPPRS